MALFHAYRSCSFDNLPSLQHIYYNGSCSAYPTGVEASISDQIGRHRGVLHSVKRLKDSAKQYNILPNGHFDFYEGVVPIPKQIAISNHRQTTHTSWKEWQNARQKGIIKISPMQAHRCEAVLMPGTDIPDSGFTNQTTSNTGFYTGDWGFGAVNCYQPQNRLDITHFAGLELAHTPYVLRAKSEPKPFVTVKAAYQTFEVDSLTLPPADVAYRAWSSILSEIGNKEYDQGLITSAVAEANSGIYDLLTELGEIRETMSFIFGIFADILRLSKQVKRDVLRARKRPGATAASLADEISAIWMKYRYAVSPLVYSANDLLDLRTGLFGRYQTFRKGNSRTFHVNVDEWSSGPIEVVDRVWCKYQYDVLDGKHGLKLNLLSTAWELTPLSFVVDWVLNIGDLLSAMVLPSNVQQTAYQYSRQLRETEISLRRPGNTQAILLQCQYYRANPITPIMHLGLTVDVSMTWKRWIDALALSWFTTKKAFKSK